MVLLSVHLKDLNNTSSFERISRDSSKASSQSNDMTNRYSFYTPSAVDTSATVSKSKAKNGRASAPAQRQPEGPPSKEGEKMAALSQKLTTYARGCDRRQILRLLGSNQYTKMYTLKNAEVEDIAAAEREASCERGVLNGVKFLQVRGSGVGECIFT